MLLSKAYEEFAHVVERQSRLYLAELSFLGDTYSLDLLPQIYGAACPGWHPAYRGADAPAA